MTNQMKYEQYKYILIFTFFYSLKLFAEPNLIQAAALIIQPQYLQKYEENIVIADKKKLLNNMQLMKVIGQILLAMLHAIHLVQKDIR